MYDRCTGGFCAIFGCGCCNVLCTVCWKWKTIDRVLDHVILEHFTKLIRRRQSHINAYEIAINKTRRSSLIFVLKKST